MAGQTINDRIIAARHTIAGQGLAKSVCKATTEEMIGPKKKHLDYLIHCTNEPNVSIPQLATLLIERSQSTNWVVVYKSLITCHHLMCYGNERFTQYLASSNSTFQLSNFLDKSGVQGIMAAKAGYDMSPFIRRYARYLNEKAIAYRTVAFDFCKVKRGKDDSLLRTMGTERLLKTLPALQNLLDALLEFDCSANDLTNSVINVCFMLLFRDLIRLFACYNDAIINLLEKYFDMNKKQCREALDLYKKFLIRMDRVGEFLKVAENVGIDKGDIPDLTKAPSSLLDALEQHLASIEGKKGSSTTTPTQAASNAKNVKSGVHALSSTSSSFGSAVTHNDTFVNTNGSSGMFATSDIDETLRQKVLAEEEAAMNQYKSKLQSPSSITSSTINNPFLTPPGCNAASPPGMQQQQTMDLFAAPMSLANARASDDLLQLSNPFADAFALPSQSAVTPVQARQTNNLWVTNGFSSPQLQPPSTEFVPESSFSSVFGTSEQTAATSVQDDNTAVVLSSTSAAINPFIYEPDNTNTSEYASNSVPETVNTQNRSSPEVSVAAEVAAAAAAAEFFRSDLNMYQETYDIPDLPLDDSVVIENEHSDSCLDVQIDQTGVVDVNVDISDVNNSTDDKPSVDNVNQFLIDNKTIAQSSDEQSNNEFCEKKMPPPSKAINKPPRPPPPTMKKDTEQVKVEPSIDDAVSFSIVEPIDEMCIDLGSPPAEGEVAIPGNSPAYPSIPGMFHSDPIPSGMMMMNQGIIPLNPLMVPGNVPVGNSMSGITVPLSFTQLPNPAQLIPTSLSGQSVIQTQAVPNYQIQNTQGTNASQSSGFDAFGGILKPASSQGQQLGAANTQTNATQSQNKVLTGDLESSLASLAENLSINSRTAPVKGVQWNSPKNGAKMGSSSWTPQPMAATTGAGYRPMGQGMASAPMATMQPSPFQPQMTMGIRPIATMIPATGMMTGPIGMVPQIPPLPTQMPLQAAGAAIPQQHQQQGLQFH